ncbi:ribonuclease J [Roseibium alexandrii]|jgi:ribonuclease J|uniref:Putative hydrolase of the metallo-beta-lactamase superfamily n=1 Tax=Roseibium alexandrii (strain DSM 17067 / NCIMB 14079 / DFL-11) TaxID=244592 RepID=A0A5E8GTH9_ROSAD|nr:ribonuclease J [Roseibium alexandrii]EEE43145.1 putative hydrolase of the metallo-beta-lactamase superfamily [Roseibium alexandrii DFL-11]
MASAKDKENDIVFLPLGGVGEIGMNLGLYGFGPEGNRKWLIVDCGVSFAGPELPGIDLVMPDIKFLEDEVNNIAGMVITHAHEDHYGAILHLWPFLKVPVYATAFTAGLLAAKTESEPGAEEVPVTVVRQGERHTIGPFDVEFVAMAHSIPEPCALAIRTPAGLVLHTGDWKIDLSPGIGQPIDLDRLAELGREGVMALVCDSTNAVRDGVSPSEADVAAELTKVIGRAKHRVAVTTFASNVARIRAIARAAAANERDVVVVGRSMHRAIEVANELEYMDDLPAFHDEEAYGYLPRDKVVLLCTGSQGENRAALARIAAGDHRNIALAQGDMVIFSSRTIPGNEKEVGAVLNNLADKDVEIVTDKDALVHVSGHPRRGELEQLYKLVQPKVVLPVHGEPLHLAAHAAFAKEQGVPEVIRGKNGDVIRLVAGRAAIIDEAPFGILVKDGRILDDPEVTGVKERRKLSFAGAAIITLVVNRSGELLDEPNAVLLGLPDTDDDGEPMEDIVRKAVIGAVTSIPKARRKDKDLIAEAARRAARSEILDVWGKKTLCKVVVTQL